MFNRLNFEVMKNVVNRALWAKNKNTYIQPVVEVMPVMAISRVCAESFFESFSIGSGEPGAGR